jgi:hypothetical protein
MSSSKLFVMLLAVVFIIGAVGSAGAALDGNAVMTQYNCTGCHGTSTIKGTNNALTVTKIMNSIAPGGLMANISSVNKLTLAEAQAIADVLFPPAPVACTGYAYSAWSACGANGQRTRTVTGNTPAGCTGTPSTKPVLIQACTPTPVACTGYTYSAWSACGTNGKRTRTVIGNTPAGCTGTPSTTPVLTQACTPTPVACTGYTYSAWSACGANGQRTRTVMTKTPAGCTGTPSTAAVLTQACTPPTTNGTTLYMQRCSACHGSIQRSQVRGVSASDIKEAISEVSAMSFLKFLTNAKIQAIADALETTTPPPPPPVPSGGPHPTGWLTQHPTFVDRNGTSSCTACHGANLQGGIGPSCFSCHSEAD